MLREVIVKIGLERIDTQERVIVEALLDSGATGLVMSSEFTRKQRFKLKNIKNLIYMTNTDEMFNKKGLIENTVEVNIYYQGHREDRDRCDWEAEVEHNFRNAMACMPQS